MRSSWSGDQLLVFGALGLLPMPGALRPGPLLLAAALVFLGLCLLNVHDLRARLPIIRQGGGHAIAAYVAIFAAMTALAGLLDGPQSQRSTAAPAVGAASMGGPELPAMPALAAQVEAIARARFADDLRGAEVFETSARPLAMGWTEMDRQPWQHSGPLRTYARVTARFVSLCEVLATVHRVTGFLDAFSHVQLTHTHERPPDKVFFAGITGLGCNIGIAKLAQISKHINQSSLERTVNWYFSAETLAAANDRILSFLQRLALPKIFARPDGIRITTSDGQKYTQDGESLTAARSYKYFGKEQGITAYTFRDNRDFLYHSTVFSPTDREAWYVIDGMLHNDVVTSDMHATDTHGATPPTFATLHFLGVFFAPRLADLPSRTLSSFVKRKVYQERGYPLLPDKQVDTEIIQEQWDNVLRFMATIVLKETAASQLFQRLHSYSHQHPLYRALKAFGQIIETIFILRYIDDVAIRQAVEKELNKLEHSQKFAKAVFHGGNQEFSQETREEQLIAERCKRLIENAIIYWNYLYLSERLADTSDGPQRQELLRHIRHSSMATWQHINLLGEYDYSDERVNTVTPFHLPKILAVKVT